MKNLFFVLFIFSANLLKAQEMPYNYSGFIQLDDDSKIPFQLKFKVEQNIIIGYSVSDSFGLDETKSSIVGTVNQDVFLINEIDIMSSKSAVLDSEFCLLQMNLQLVEENEVRYLKGGFNGFYSDSVPCVNGEIVLIDSLSLVSVPEKLPQIKKHIKQQIKTLSKDVGLSFQTNNEELVLLIWDSGIVDNDLISVYANGKIILENYSVQKRKKKLKITLQDGLNSILVKAITVGNFAPNTSRIQIRGTRKNYEAVTFLKKGEQTEIRVKKIAD